MNPPASAGDVGLIPGSRRSPGEGNGKPRWYSCLGNPMDREAWRATVHAVKKELKTTQDTTASQNIAGGTSVGLRLLSDVITAFIRFIYVRFPGGHLALGGVYCIFPAIFLYLIQPLPWVQAYGLKKYQLVLMKSLHLGPLR